MFQTASMPNSGLQQWPLMSSLDSEASCLLTRSKSSSKSRAEPRMRSDLTDAARGASHDSTACMLTCRRGGWGLCIGQPEWKGMSSSLLLETGTRSEQIADQMLAGHRALCHASLTRQPSPGGFHDEGKFGPEQTSRLQNQAQAAVWSPCCGWGTAGPALLPPLSWKHAQRVSCAQSPAP